MIKYITAMLLAVVCGAALVFGQSGLPAMTPREAAPKIASGEMLLVDVRTPQEWQATGLAKNAVAIDLRDSGFQAKLAALRKGKEDKPVALICAGGIRSAQVQVSLAQQGVTQTVNIIGGMSGYGNAKGWIADGLPVESAPR